VSSKLLLISRIFYAMSVIVFAYLLIQLQTLSIYHLRLTLYLIIGLVFISRILKIIALKIRSKEH